MESRGKKERELVHEIANRRTAAGTPFVNLGWKKVLGDAQFLAEKTDLILLRLKILVFLVLKDKVQKHEPRADEIKRVPAAIAEVVLFYLAVERPGKEVEH